MKTIVFYYKIASIAILLVNISLVGFASESQLENLSVLKKDVPGKYSPIKKFKTTDTYLMVMQQQVEKGDQAINYSFYVEQLTDLYKIYQMNADLQINDRFYMNNIIIDQHTNLALSDASITSLFNTENAE
jgi:hypothetical protein